MWPVMKTTRPIVVVPVHSVSPGRPSKESLPVGAKSLGLLANEGTAPIVQVMHGAQLTCVSHKENSGL